MVTVTEAEEIILSHSKNFGTEHVDYNQSYRRVLANPLIADRDLPPFNRVTMDGIAIDYKGFSNGNRQFSITGIQAAGSETMEITSETECIEIMTGAALPRSTNTIIRYEDLNIANDTASVLSESVQEGQNIHVKASDKKKGEVIVEAGNIITPAIISIAASIGVKMLPVKKNPSVVIVSTGDELVGIDSIPNPFQIRSSNAYFLQSALLREGIKAEILHLKDNKEDMIPGLQTCLEYDVMIISGGISMGKFDMVPAVLEELEVKKLFYKVAQKPGRPFWFGRHQKGTLVFALPGNPMSTCLCYYRFFLPWLKNSLGLEQAKAFAALSEPFSFKPMLTCFLPVKLVFTEEGKLIAYPVKANGSGDYSSLTTTDAFLELPAEQSNFEQGEIFKVLPLPNNYL